MASRPTLVMDTCGGHCAVAIVFGPPSPDADIIEIIEPMARGHAERIVPMVAECLRLAGVEIADFGLIAVTKGPGSFTGVRIGVATARGLSLASSVPVVGVVTLEAHALALARGKPFTLVQDARRDQVYAQAFAGDGRPTAAPVLAALSEIEADDVVTVGAEPIPHWAIASVGKRLWVPDWQPPSPLYLRPPDAKPQTGRALVRQ